MCRICDNVNFTSSNHTLGALHTLSIYQWCDSACGALAAALANDNELLLGGRAGPCIPKGRGNTSANRDALTAALRTPPLLQADQLLHLKRFISEPTWEWLAATFSYHTVVRARYHTAWCTYCTGAAPCESSQNSKIELLTAKGQSINEVTELYLSRAGLVYERVAHRLVVDGNFSSTIVENEWANLKKYRKKPSVDRRYSRCSSKRAFDVARRALHLQLRNFPGMSRKTLAACAYVVLAAIRADRQTVMQTPDYRLPRTLRQATSDDIPLGRNVRLTYSPATNLFFPQYHPTRNTHPS